MEMNAVNSAQVFVLAVANSVRGGRWWGLGVFLGRLFGYLIGCGIGGGTLMGD